MVIYIDGPINSGKTTVSRLIAHRILKTVHVEIDDLRHIADCLTLDEAMPFALEDAICLTRNWARRGYHVVVSWPLGPEEHRLFSDAVQTAGADLMAFTLLPREDVCLSRRGNRELEACEKARIQQMYDWRSHSDPIGYVIDNSDQSPTQTVDHILNLIRKEKPNQALEDIGA